MGAGADPGTGTGAAAVMDAEDGEAGSVLVEQRLGRQGLDVKLDRGFEDGVYCVYVEFDALASRVGFAAAHRQAVEFGGLLHRQLAQMSRHSIGDVEDPSYTGDPQRKRDLELTYLAFPVLTCDSRYRDAGVMEEFKLALLRAGQQWDQLQARADTRRHASRKDAFRERFGALLAGDAYRGIDDATKAQLLNDVLTLTFPPRGR